MLRYFYGMLLILTISAHGHALNVAPSEKSLRSGVCSRWSQPKQAGQIDHDALNEESGLAYSSDLKRLYHINDSGDGPYFYATEMDGAKTQKIEIQGFVPADTEDLAYGRCLANKNCLAVMDIGDNREKRKSIKVALLEEKKAFATKETPLVVLHLRYPDGPHNAEAAAFDPSTGDLVIVTKEMTGGKAQPAKVFKLRNDLIQEQISHSTSSPNRPIELQFMGEIDVPRLIKGTGYDGIVTAMDIAPNGETFLLLTYSQAIEMKLTFSGSSLPTSPLVEGIDYAIIPLVALPQQESIVYLNDGNDFLYSSEQGPGSSNNDAPLMQLHCEDRRSNDRSNGLESAWVTVDPQGSLFEFINGTGSYGSGPDATFVKLDLKWSDPIVVNRIEFSTCNGPLRDGIEVFTNFDEQRLYLEGGKSKFSFSPPDPQFQSITFNFRANQNFCLKDLRFLTTAGKQLRLRTPGKLVGTGQTSSEIKQGTQPWQLFDGQPHSFVVLKSKAEKNRPALQFQFANPVELQRLRFWNGSQKSTWHLQSIGRIRSFKLIAKEEKGQTLTLGTFTLRGDALGPQVIELKEKQNVQNLSLEVLSTFEGKAVGDIAISELQFGNDNGWHILDLSSSAQENSVQLKKLFTDRGLDSILDQSLQATDEDRPWILRLRSDKTFFLRGYSDEIDDKKMFSVLGSFDVRPGSNPREITLDLVGYKAASPIELDADSCGRKCTSHRDARDIPTSKELVQQRVTLKRGKEIYLHLVNKSAARASGIRFSSIRMKRSLPIDE